MNYFEYKGQKYYPGTRVKMKVMFSEPREFVFRDRYTDCYGIDNLNFSGGYLYTFPADKADKNILEILEAKSSEDMVVTRTNKRQTPPAWDVEIGWIWYIIIMVVGTIFKDRITIWIFATVVFFLWKNGFFNGDKK